MCSSTDRHIYNGVRILLTKILRLLLCDKRCIGKICFARLTKPCSSIIVILVRDAGHRFFLWWGIDHMNGVAEYLRGGFSHVSCSSCELQLRTRNGALCTAGRPSHFGMKFFCLR